MGDAMQSDDDDPSGTYQDRDTLDLFSIQSVKKGKMDAYRAANNAWSLDGLGGMKAARRGAGDNLLLSDVQLRLRRIFQQREAVLMGALLAVIAMLLLQCWPLIKDGVRHSMPVPRDNIAALLQTSSGEL